MSKQRSRFDIEVTDDDIAKAQIGDSYKCVIAQAVARQFPNAHHIDVDTQTVRWSDENGRHVFLTPYAATGYVVAFDAGEEIHPFKFHLRDAVPAAQKRATSPAAKAAVKTRSKRKYERQRLAKAEAVLADPTAPADKIAAAKERVREAPVRIEAATAAYDDVKAAYTAAGESMSEKRVSETTRKATPRVFKTKKRAYGQRLLRVNQAEGRKQYPGR